MFSWKKKGLIFTPDRSMEWMQSHAQVPYAVNFEQFIRVYFSTREKQDNDGMFKSYSGYVDLDKNDLTKVIRVSRNPIIDLGGPGQFDEFGSMAGSVVEHEGNYYLYYCGWQRMLSVPYNWMIGIAVSEDGERFEKIGRGPIVGPVMDEPYLQACPIVYKTASNDWHMFYLSGIKWIKYNNKIESQYLLMHATSRDGIAWVRNGKPIISPMVDDECQTSASIIERDGRFHMFFSYRFGTNFRLSQSRGYRIGYAWSDDLCSWSREEDKMSGIDVSSTGWDSEMVAYPHVTTVNEKTIMFYCGNHFGKNGFGYAELHE